MIDIEPISFGLKTFIPKPNRIREVITPRGVFIVTKGSSTNTIELKNTEVIYTDTFASEVSDTIHHLGKDVEVNCGPESFRTKFIMSELMLPGMLKRIQNMDMDRIDDWERQPHLRKIKIDSGIRKIRKSMFDLFGTKQIYVVFSELYDSNETSDEVNKRRGSFVPVADSGDVDEYFTMLRQEDVNAPDFIPEGNKYMSARVIEVDDSILWDLRDIENTAEESGIVQVRKKPGLMNRSTLGLFVERGKKCNEVVINLNGRTEEYFKELFLPLVIYFLEKGRTVLVDCDLEDLDTLHEKVYSSDIYETIFQETGSIVELERITAYNHPRETHSFVILEPRQYS